MIMQELSLNRLTGALPASFADLAAMETCALDDNRLCGPLQPELLLRLLALRRFDLRGNLFQDDADVANTILAGACSRGLAANVCCCVLAVRARRDDGLSSLIILFAAALVVATHAWSRQPSGSASKADARSSSSSGPRGLRQRPATSSVWCVRATRSKQPHPWLTHECMYTTGLSRGH